MIWMKRNTSTMMSTHVSCLILWSFPGNAVLISALDDHLPPMPALGWDGLDPDISDRNRQLFFLEGNQRRPVLTRMDDRSPFPPRFMAGPNRGPVGM